MNLIDRLHNKFKDLPRISPDLVKRYAKMDWEACDDIYEELLDRRKKDGIEETEKPRYGRKLKNV